MKKRNIIYRIILFFVVFIMFMVNNVYSVYLPEGWAKMDAKTKKNTWNSTYGTTKVEMWKEMSDEDKNEIWGAMNREEQNSSNNWDINILIASYNPETKTWRVKNIDKNISDMWRRRLDQEADGYEVEITWGTNEENKANAEEQKNEIEEIIENTEDTEEQYIYKQPENTSNHSTGLSLYDMIKDSDDFIKEGNDDKIDLSELAELSSVIYNITFQISIAVAVVVGLILGVQFLLASSEGKANVKKALMVYTIGCVVAFGSFAIWKIAVTIIEQL